MWSIDIVISNYPSNSVSKKRSLFCKMFPDNKIAENFSCGKPIVEHVAFFDESFNKTSKHGQMDIQVLYWDSFHNYVAACYYYSEFMCKASLKDVFESLSTRLSSISKSKLLQVSCDSPNVNLSFLDLLEEDRNEKELSQHIHIGSCGLHTLHNFMKHGEKASGWNVKVLVSTLQRIFY